MAKISTKHNNVLPGFTPALGFTVFYLSLIVLIPLSAAFLKTTLLTWDQFWHTRDLAARAGVVPPEFRRGVDRCGHQCGVRAAHGLGADALYFPGKKLVDALVDLPFALPTAVAGIALTAIYAPNGWMGSILEPQRHQGGIYAAGCGGGVDVHWLTFCRQDSAAGAGRPGGKAEEAAASLGANRWQTFTRVILPAISPHYSPVLRWLLRAQWANTAR